MSIFICMIELKILFLIRSNNDLKLYIWSGISVFPAIHIETEDLLSLHFNSMLSRVIFNIFAFAYFQNQPSTSGMKYQVL